MRLLPTPDAERRRRHPSWLERSIVVIVGLIGALGISGEASGQPPGSRPPQGIFSGRGSGDRADDQGLPIQAFLFLSESDSPVVVPGISWEELQRLQGLDSGNELANQFYSYQTFEVTGSAVDTRAELLVTVRLSIESTGNRWVAIPLRMANFHQLAPPDVTGPEEYRLTLAGDGGGYVLWVKTSNRREVTLRMNVASRVTDGSTRSLDFQLPDAPSTVRLTVDEANVAGDVTGQGYETFQLEEVAGGRSRMVVESGGGAFTLRWGPQEQKRDDAPLLEVISRINVAWDSPQEAPRVAVQLQFQNVRRSIDSFDLRLPAGAILSGDATLGADGRSVSIGPPISDPAGDRRQVLIPDEERQPRIDLNFAFTLPAANVSASNPLAFRVPEVVGALRHRGEISIQTGTDYRLRWNAQPWVRAVLGGPVDETTPGRSYRFEFDRGTFELPLWLSAKQRQVRISATSQVSVHDATARLELLIRASDRAADGRGPQIDMADWNLESIENAETGESLDAFQGDGYPEIDYPSGSGSPPSIRIRGYQSIDPQQVLLSIQLPRIVKTDDGLLVPTSTLEVVSTGRSMLVVDLDASQHLERMLLPAGDTTGESTVSRFRIDSQEEAAVLVGTVAEQPQRITLASDGTVALDENGLQTTLLWTVTSQSDLEGVLPIRMPDLSAVGGRMSGPGDAVATGLRENLSPDDQEFDSQWTVTVMDQPAVLVPIDQNRFDLVSDRLAAGTVKIRWTRRQWLDVSESGDSTTLLALPRPAIEDVTIRGPVRISLRGTVDTELLSTSSATAGEFLLDTLPPTPLRLRLRTRDTLQEELSVNQLVLRSAIGHSVRHEQVLANVQGGDEFRIGLPVDTSDVMVEGYIDRQATQVSRDGDTLILPLPTDQSSHVVDLQVWLPEAASDSSFTIRPLLKLPIGVGRVYWQIVVPRNSHLVWASPTMGRSMTWSFAPWRMGRIPSHDDIALTAMVGASNHPMPKGNAYLYVGSDVGSFRVVSLPRVLLWLIVATIVLSVALMLSYFPQTRHPLTAVCGAILFGGLLAIAADAAVIVGHLAVIALVLVIVMIAVRSLVTPRRSDRILAPREPRRRSEASTQSLPSPPPSEQRSSVSRTRALPASPSEASS